MVNVGPIGWLLAAGLRKGSGMISSKEERWLATLGFVVLTVAYFMAAFSAAGRVPFWMDEVGALTAARQPTVSDVVAALWKGAEFSPPTYHLLLHPLLLALSWDDQLLLPRIPSVVAVYGVAVCGWALLHRRVRPLSGLMAFGVLLDSSLFGYAVQVRQYGLLALGAAGALLLWDAIEDSRRPRLLALTMGMVLAACMSLHYYACIIVAILGVAEIAWSLAAWRLRPFVWLAFALPALAAAGLAPLALHQAAFNAADSSAPLFYARPNAFALANAVLEIIPGGRVGTLTLLVAAGFSGLFWAVGLRDEAPSPGSAAACLRLRSMALALGLMPLLAFAFALVFTHAYSSRYVSASALLTGLAAGCVLDRAPRRHLLAMALLPVLVLTISVRGALPSALDPALTCLQAAPPGEPVVVGEGLLFLELAHAAPRSRRGDLVYLRSPPGEASPDPTNEHAVERLAQIDPTLRVFDRVAFLAAHPAFILLARPTWTIDTTTKPLLAQGQVLRLLAMDSDAILLQASPALAPACCSHDPNGPSP